MKRTAHSKVMTIVNRFVKQGYNRANATVKALVLVKMQSVPTKVSGVTYSKRQQAIEHLTHYRPEDIRISLYRDSTNAYDSNAVASIATVRNKGAYTMDYLPKALAAFIAPLIDSGKMIVSRLRHTNATLMINSGVPITTIAVRLGHANPSTTTKIYTHAIKSADAAAAETLDNIFNDNVKTTRKRA